MKLVKFNFSKCWCDHENKVKITKIKSTLSPLLVMYLWKGGQNPSTGSKDNVRKRNYAEANAEGIQIQTNMSPSLEWKMTIL